MKQDIIKILIDLHENDSWDLAEIFTIKQTLRWNIEDVMRWFEWTKTSLTKWFQELLRDWWDRVQAQEFINKEVDHQVSVLREREVKVDEIEWNRFIREFKEQRLAEFDRLKVI